MNNKLIEQLSNKIVLRNHLLQLVNGHPRKINRAEEKQVRKLVDLLDEEVVKQSLNLMLEKATTELTEVMAQDEVKEVVESPNVAGLTNVAEEEDLKKEPLVTDGDTMPKKPRAKKVGSFRRTEE